MRYERLALAAAAVLASSACTKVNPDYCADAGAFNYSCAALDAGARDRHDAASDASDAEETGDARTDAAEAMPPVCSRDNDCAAGDAGTPACDTNDGGVAKCVECTQNKHCSGTKPVCDTAAEKCVECIGSGAECTADAAKSACNTTTQTCVECLNNTKCTGAMPICEASTNKCRGCAADSECRDIGPGICVDWDHHCATNAEVISLNRSGSCDAAKAQYCSSTVALGALSPQARVLLITGTSAVAAIDVPNAAPDPLLIVGRGGRVGTGVGDVAGVHVAGSRRVYVRDLTLTGGTVGVLAEQGADLRLTRCTIVGNGGGGILISGASFEITNTIVANNHQGDSTGGLYWAGVRLGDLPAAGTARFENNTVVGNLGPGISCAATYPIATSIVHGNTGAQAIGCMTATPCCGASDPDPALDADTYRLMSGSPCIDKLTATSMTPAVDIDGQPRPTTAGKLDCGADELQ